MRRLLIGLAAVLLAGLLAAPAGADNGKHRDRHYDTHGKQGHNGHSANEFHSFFGLHPFHFSFMRVQAADIANQGGEGVASKDGAKVLRTHHGVHLKMTMPTPESGKYVYPAAAPGREAIEPGWPEVFTGWAFVFNFPEKCTDPCNGDDLGDTPAKGGVANFAGEVIWRDKLELRGHIARDTMLGNPPGLPKVRFRNPKGAEIHMAIAPHGAPIREAIGVQTSAPTGSPACGCWWVGVILPNSGGSH